MSFFSLKLYLCNCACVFVLYACWFKNGSLGHTESQTWQLYWFPSDSCTFITFINWWHISRNLLLGESAVLNVSLKIPLCLKCVVAFAMLCTFPIGYLYNRWSCFYAVWLYIALGLFLYNYLLHVNVSVQTWSSSSWNQALTFNLISISWTRFINMLYVWATSYRMLRWKLVNNFALFRPCKRPPKISS